MHNYDFTCEWPHLLPAYLSNSSISKKAAHEMILLLFYRSNWIESYCALLRLSDISDF